MSALTRMTDAVMCLMWITTYTLVLIGTCRYRYPMISPYAQAVIAPFELSVTVMFITRGQLGFNYPSVACIYWTVIEIAIIAVILKSGFVKRKHIAPYIVLCGAITCAMLYLVTFKGYMLFFSYFNTFVGVAIWFGSILRRDYPMKPLALAAFITKFVGDILAAIVYFGVGGWCVDLMSILLPPLDFAFVVVYVVRRKQNKCVTAA